MFSLAQRTQTEVSAIRQIFAQIKILAKDREAKGLSMLIDLSIGQPHIPPNPEVMQQLQDMKISPASQGYTAAQGETATLDTIVKLYKKYYPSVSHKNEEVMTTIGGSGALSNVFSILVEKKDDIVLTFEPYFAAYSGQIQEWGGTLKKIPTIQNNFRPSAAALEIMLKANPTTKALIMNYPNNPSGVSLTKEEAISIAKVLDKYPHVVIIIDDVYRDFNYQEHFTVLDVAPHLKDRCVVINSGAKGLLGAPGERVGMCAAHSSLIKAMLPRQTNGMSSVPYRTQAALQFAAAAHLKNPQNEWLINARREYKTNVDTAALAFKREGFILSKPDGAFYLLVCAKHLIGKINPHTLQEIKSDIDIAQYFLHSAGVATVPGSGFGVNPEEGYLRISCAQKNNLLLEAVTRIGKASRALAHNPMLIFTKSKPKAMEVNEVYKPASSMLFFSSKPIKASFDYDQGRTNTFRYR